MTKILVIDDEIEICEMMRDFFGRRNYDVIYALTGHGGLDAFSIEKPHLVLLDLCLKDMSGLEVLKRIKDTDRDCIVIVITGSASDEDRKDAIRLGVNYYICKPCSMSKLNDLIVRL